MADRNAARTRERILEIAGELFRARGYAGTSIADIAGRLGTSKSALYYHFASKEEILDALLAGVLAAHARVAELAGSAEHGPAEVLGAVVDMVAGSGAVLATFGADPSVAAALAGRDHVHGLRAKDEQVVARLAGGDPGALAAVAALAVAKDGGRALMAERGALSAADRADLLAAALRALDG
ncbi:hypothetical protein BJF78_25145 [Pseudonocardia sp. CNS-139]|nr:hypothetical protein BJF78_25145 [Pseudonocardia sp. CNS-139]